jgi:Transposase DDE domain
MRHGRKSKSKRFNGYKQHIGTDLDTALILACTVMPANRPEEEATAAIQEDLAHQELFPDKLFIDRGYINSAMTGDVLASGGDVICKPWRGASCRFSPALTPLSQIFSRALTP